jgi:hypothetical protein
MSSMASMARGQCARRAIAEPKQMGDQILLPRAPACFRRHVKPVVPIAFAVVNTPVSRTVDVRQAACRKNNCRIYSQHD